MNKRKEIEELSTALYFADDMCNDGRSCCDELAEFVIGKGYRKQSEVIDEFVKMLKDTSMTKWDYHEAVDIEEIDRIAAKMKGGAE